ncbi:uncharacterized protein NECHADRAFT_85695 [Fusarium vanettenii 77-13-4]|uniref:Uncharacterized protein n=1 Tax=Fusarium vanettenii (strain ATCC MYA-4622 / CBS 123669 / FGSC 9596 / NRRL 45880 / 77-13-4) TaxID=660122 RepID=C7ZPE9_FUSV7|nr:uncharacterized protein NECHADRAFT_85695 [Fusarium vanettenii 77-13-4]EEU34337.1 predicted protein [Fusarium vanettenii 77-13-4]
MRANVPTTIFIRLPSSPAGKQRNHEVRSSNRSQCASVDGVGWSWWKERARNCSPRAKKHPSRLEGAVSKKSFAAKDRDPCFQPETSTGRRQRHRKLSGQVGRDRPGDAIGHSATEGWGRDEPCGHFGGRQAGQDSRGPWHGMGFGQASEPLQSASLAASIEPFLASCNGTLASLPELVRIRLPGTGSPEMVV